MPLDIKSKYHVQQSRRSDRMSINGRGVSHDLLVVPISNRHEYLLSFRPSIVKFISGRSETIYTLDLWTDVYEEWDLLFQLLHSQFRFHGATGPVGGSPVSFASSSAMSASSSSKSKISKLLLMRDGVSDLIRGMNLKLRTDCQHQAARPEFIMSLTRVEETI